MWFHERSLWWGLPGGALAAVLICPPVAAQSARPLTGATLEWKVDLGQAAAGGPVVFGSTESAEGVVVTLGSGKVLLISPRGKKLATMDLDLTAAGPSVAGDLNGTGAQSIISADAWASLYCFDSTGKRLWKHQRMERTGGGFNYPVLADLDGDGKLEAIMTGARGKLYAVDAQGRLRLEVHVTNYRVSAPAVGDLNHDGRPELVFGSEDSEIYCIDNQGEVLWTRRLEQSRFGRALPLIADAHKDGRYQVFVSTPFVGPGPGLFALDGVTGRVLWKAPSELQSYNSIVLADLNGGGRNRLLYGDKNTRLYAVDAEGRALWNRQLDGRGIFFAAAVADLDGNGAATVFQVVRGAGADGKSLYALNASGEIVDAMAVEGGGGSSPALCRFKGEKELKLLVIGSGKLFCYHLPQASGAKILWPGIRNDSLNSGFVRSGKAVAKLNAPVAESSPLTAARVATGGINKITVAAPAADTYLTARVVEPDGAIRLRIIPAGMHPDLSFEAVKAGSYQVRVRWMDAGTNQARKTERYAYTLAKPAKPVQVARMGMPAAVRQIANPWPNFDAGEFLKAYRGWLNQVAVSMLGNEYESAAVAITNLRDQRVTLRLECGPFVSQNKASMAAEQVVEFRDVPMVLPESTGRPSEDVLPLLGEGQLVWLGPRETRKVWLTFRSRRLEAGVHQAVLRVGDLLSVDPPLEVQVTVKVHPVRLPEKHVYRHGNWLYLANIQDPQLREATMKDALEHGTNVFNVPGVSFRADAQGNLGGASSEPHDTLVKMLRGKAFFMINGSVGLIWPPGFKPEPKLEAQTYAEAIRRYAAHMKWLGVDYQEWAFYTMDEPGLMGRDASFDRWVEGVKRIKAADPKVQIYANPAGGARARLLREVAGLVDVWQPDLHLVREEPEELGAIFKMGQYWHYEAPGDQRNLDPLGYYRMKPWVAFQMGMTGGGYWVYSSGSYWFFDRNLPIEYGTVYPTQKGPVTTKRWEGSRDGIEDFELLWMVRETAKRAPPPLAREAQDLVDEAVRFVTQGQEKVSDISRQIRPYTPDFGKWMEYRDRLIQMQLRLAK